MILVVAWSKVRTVIVPLISGILGSSPTHNMNVKSAFSLRFFCKGGGHEIGRLIPQKSAWNVRNANTTRISS
jgi:hypothetical protein